MFATNPGAKGNASIGVDANSLYNIRYFLLWPSLGGDTMLVRKMASKAAFLMDYMDNNMVHNREYNCWQPMNGEKIMLQDDNCSAVRWMFFMQNVMAWVVLILTLLGAWKVFELIGIWPQNR